jgi:hypothetical protein
MTRFDIITDMRATLDRDHPGWRAALREQMDAEKPGWLTAVVKVMTPDGETHEVALLANPERVPDRSEIDPATDPLAGW